MRHENHVMSEVLYSIVTTLFYLRHEHHEYE